MATAPAKTRKPVLDEATINKHIKLMENHIQKELEACFRDVRGMRQRKLEYLKSIQPASEPLKQLLKIPPDIGFPNEAETSERTFLASEFTGGLSGGYELPHPPGQTLPTLPGLNPFLMTIVRPPYYYGSPLEPITETLPVSQRMVLYSHCWPSTGAMELAAAVMPVDAPTTIVGPACERRASALIIATEYSVPPRQSQVTVRCSFSVLGESNIFVIGPEPVQGWASVNIHLILSVFNYNQGGSRTARGDIYSRLENYGNYHLDRQRISTTGSLAVSMPVLPGDRLAVGLSAMLTVGTRTYPNGNLVAVGDVSHFAPIYEAPGTGVGVPFFRIS